MNTKILSKCVEELNKPEPNLSYIKGMLETVIEMSDNQPISSYAPLGLAVPQNVPSYPYQNQTTPSLVNLPTEDEGSGIVSAYAGGLPAQIQ